MKVRRTRIEAVTKRTAHKDSAVRLDHSMQLACTSLPIDHVVNDLRHPDEIAKVVRQSRADYRWRFWNRFVNWRTRFRRG